MLVDGAEGGAEFGWGLGLVGGQQWAQQPVVQLGVEDGDLDSVGGQDIAAGVRDPPDQTSLLEAPRAGA